MAPGEGGGGDDGDDDSSQGGDASLGDALLAKEMVRRKEAAERREGAELGLQIAETVGKVVCRAADAASLAGLPFAEVATRLVEHAVEAYKQVVANRAKCAALLSRMQLLRPAVDQLAGLLDGGACHAVRRTCTLGGC